MEYRMTHFMRRISMVFSGVAMIGLAYPVHADTLRDKQTEACKGDAVRLCALAIPNEKKITACMERKQDKLSPKCRAFFKKGSKTSPAHKPKSK
ncbi:MULTISPECIES: hypothetical protein [Acetobacter]|uniref:Uncharacterized protein n=2 Tax=Acetobacter TaxID=434 RepID=A0AAN1PFT7_9PROT|nr:MULTISPECIES: hypothetical protein [Acetobacter]ASL41342.1 hypothetical protein CBI36_13765 [Acetobacter oryzifermentans]AXM99336.1 hypothetical protein CJF59_01170 [Acetobacter pomorum]KAA8385068.1 hypothetical protein FKW31_09655 [Acetobacter sp. DmW_136]KAA8394095.1 hypothetical protein FKW19_13230 [Acetobacter sp. DmW_125128]KAA8394804.1 hypothetical protein FKW22_09995 [Acetobacter sp. DmW_125124]